jgi:formylmethanofuran dehydrogenase subunit E-like metal-binding protein
MMKERTVSGARAKVQVHNSDGSVTTIGAFNNVSYGVTYGVQEVAIMGAYTAQELVYTHVDPITLTCTGYRVAGAGPYSTQGGSMPLVKDMLNFEGLQLQVYDRRDNKLLDVIKNVKPIGFDVSGGSRDLFSQTTRFMGILLEEDGIESAESTDGVNGAATIPNGTGA